jgi:uncharacterized protein
MGYSEIDIKLSTDFSDSDLKRKISKELKINEFNHYILRKSLDARNKKNIHWIIRAGIESRQIKEGTKPREEIPVFPDKMHGKGKKVVIGGCGPSGLFAALVFQSSGYETTVIEKGKPVAKRIEEIERFEKTGSLPKNSGYCFGEGGAGTFSDGKLTSRTKAISLEKNFIFNELISVGAPKEIAYMTHPHLGSDSLTEIVPSLMKKFRSVGGKVLFETEITGINYKNSRISSVETVGLNSGTVDGDIFVFAPGHSSFDFYRMLLSEKIQFMNKPFAIGFRVEHRREEINLSQWGVKELAGVKAAEYRLTAKCSAGSSVFTFCMCPGGKVIQAAPFQGVSVVNGMSDYKRNGKYSNSAVVTPFNIEEFLKKELRPFESLEFLETMERKFYGFSNSFDIPAMNISDIVNNKKSSSLPKDFSYPFKSVSADFSNLFPSEAYEKLKEGLKIFTRKVSCFQNGVAYGLESKTSSPLKAVRTETLTTPPFENLYICGEGSGHAGGIISSAADGIKVALSSMKQKH